jgi:hypothetical protein
MHRASQLTYHLLCTAKRAKETAVLHLWPTLEMSGAVSPTKCKSFVTCLLRAGPTFYLSDVILLHLFSVRTTAVACGKPFSLQYPSLLFSVNSCAYTASEVRGNSSHIGGRSLIQL